MTLVRKKFLFIVLFVLAAMGAIQGIAVFAEELAIPSLTQRVTDLTGTLSADQHDALESRLERLEREKGSQIAVLIVTTTQPEDIAQYSIRVADAWKIGREKVADGVIVIIAKNDRKMRIEVGRGLEGAIPDVYAKRIIADIMAPKFKQGDFAGGINAGVDRLAGLIGGEPLPEPETRSNENSLFEGMLPFILFAGLIFGGILRAMFGNFFGSAANGGIIGVIVWVLGAGLLAALAFGVIAFVFTLLIGGGMGSSGSGGRRGGHPGWYGGGSYGGGMGGGGVFTGGGGDFGGGGASGDW